MKKPYSAVTVLVERLTSEEYPEHDLGGLPELIEAIKLQDSGPTEASRAIRKKLKYGNVHRQLRALTILDGLIANAGMRFQRSFADDPLLERLRIAAAEPTTDPDVRAKLKVLFAQWAREYKDTQGLRGIATLYNQFPQKRTRPQPPVEAPKQSSPPPSSPSTASRSTHSPVYSASSSSTPPPPKSMSPATDPYKSHKKSSSKSKNKHDKHAAFNLEKEKPALKDSLASSSVASTNLTNALKRINREKERPGENPEVMAHVDACKRLRKNILRYISHVESEQWLGSLIHANEELVAALQLFEVYNKPIDEDSDSEAEWNIVSHDDTVDSAGTKMARMNLEQNEPPPPPMPPRPGTDKGKEVEESEEEEDDPDDPFGNQYQIVDTPEATW